MSNRDWCRWVNLMHRHAIANLRLIGFWVNVTMVGRTARRTCSDPTGAKRGCYGGGGYARRGRERRLSASPLAQRRQPVRRQPRRRRRYS